MTDLNSKFYITTNDRDDPAYEIFIYKHSKIARDRVEMKTGSIVHVETVTITSARAIPTGAPKGGYLEHSAEILESKECSSAAARVHWNDHVTHGSWRRVPEKNWPMWISKLDASGSTNPIYGLDMALLAQLKQKSGYVDEKGNIDPDATVGNYQATTASGEKLVDVKVVEPKI